MSDNFKLKEQDGNFISLQERWEVAYWTKRFGVTEEQLAESIERTQSNGAKTVMADLVERGLYVTTDNEKFNHCSETEEE